MASTDALPIPRKGSAYRVSFDFRNSSTGAVITTVTGMDSKVSKDGATFSDCTNEFTEIGTSGCGYLDVTSTEMNADTVIIKATATNTNAVPVTIYMYPNEMGDIRVNVNAWDGTAVDTPATAGIPNVNLINWRGVQPMNLSSQLVQTSSAVIQSGAINAASIASGAIDGAALDASAATEIAIAVLGREVEAQGAYSLKQALSVLLAACAGVTADGGATFKSPNGVSTRIAATTNASNERTAITLTPSA